jgi:hypothetical protein
MEVSGQLHPPAALLSRKESRYPLDRRLSWAYSQSGRGGEQNMYRLLPVVEPRLSVP